MITVQIKINYFVVNIIQKIVTYVIYLSENGPKQNKKVDPFFYGQIMVHYNANDIQK